MPIVISHTNLNALGTLAFTAGQSAAQRENEIRQVEYDRRRADRDLEIEAALRQQRQEGRTRLREAEIEQRGLLDRQQAELQAQAQAQAGRQQEAAVGRQHDFDMAAFEEQMRRERERGMADLRHQQALERDALRPRDEARPTSTRPDPMAYRPGEGQTSQFAREEVRALSEHVPLTTSGDVPSSYAAFQVLGQSPMEIAESLSRLPSSQIRRLRDAAGERNPMSRYADAVLQRRAALEAQAAPGGTFGLPAGGVPAASPPIPGFGPGPAGGSIDPAQMNDRQLADYLESLYGG